MAMAVVHALLDNEKKVYGKFERFSKDKLTGIFELRKITLTPTETLQFNDTEMRVGDVEIMVATYTVPELRIGQKSNLEKYARKKDFVYTKKSVKDEELRKKGIVKAISIPFAAINEEENIRNIRTFSKILEFPAYENI